MCFHSMTSNKGNESEVQRLLTDGANLNATDENGNSALLVAAGKGNLYKSNEIGRSTYKIV